MIYSYFSPTSLTPTSKGKPSFPYKSAPSPIISSLFSTSILQDQTLLPQYLQPPSPLEWNNATYPPLNNHHPPQIVAFYLHFHHLHREPPFLEPISPWCNSRPLAPSSLLMICPTPLQLNIIINPHFLSLLHTLFITLKGGRVVNNVPHPLPNFKRKILLLS